MAQRVKRIWLLFDDAARRPPRSDVLLISPRDKQCASAIEPRPAGA